MHPLQWEYRPDGLRAPALVCAFKGWNDAADAASTALTFVASTLGGQRFATIDPEEFYDFQATRPSVKLVGGETREIVWPTVELFEARVPRAPRDMILLVGSEPSMRWRTFTDVIVELAEALGTQLVVTLGALLADVPHTRPVSVTGLASDPVLIARLGLSRSTYEGPTGIVGILHAACQRTGCPRPACGRQSRTTWPPAPTPRPPWLWFGNWRGWWGWRWTPRELEEAAAEYERRVNVAVQSDPEVQAFVERLEQVTSEDVAEEPGPLPSGDTIARDLQRFLRQRGEGPVTSVLRSAGLPSGPMGLPGVEPR